MRYDRSAMRFIRVTRGSLNKATLGKITSCRTVCFALSRTSTRLFSLLTKACLTVCCVHSHHNDNDSASYDHDHNTSRLAIALSRYRACPSADLHANAFSLRKLFVAISMQQKRVLITVSFFSSKRPGAKVPAAVVFRYDVYRFVLLYFCSNHNQHHHPSFDNDNNYST